MHSLAGKKALDSILRTTRREMGKWTRGQEKRRLGRSGKSSRMSRS